MPPLNKFITQSLLPSEDNFLSTEEFFEEYQRMVSLWMDGDSVSGQTRALMKRNSFNRLGELYPLELRFAQKTYIWYNIAFAIFGHEILQWIEAQWPANTAVIQRNSTAWAIERMASEVQINAPNQRIFLDTTATWQKRALRVWVWGANYARKKC